MNKEDLIIKLENVWKIYLLDKVKVPALKGINLEIRKKEFISIIGPSGSGKSTLLNIIGCLDLPTEGSVFLKNKNISCLSEKELSELRGKTIGFVFQEFNLISHLTALENVTLPMIFQGIPKEKRNERAKEILNILGLSHRISHKVNELSGGERQRVAIGRSLANDPEIILADEPTGNLDSLTGKKIMDILNQLYTKFKKTIVVVTHDLNIAHHSKKIIYLHDGQIKNDLIESEKIL